MRDFYIAAVVFALNMVPSLGDAAPLLGGVSSSMGVIEVWKVSLPRKQLDREDYISSCARVGMQPVCVGGATCPYHDQHCISLKLGVETENCLDPMQAIAQSLGFLSADTPHLKHLCAYMGSKGDVDVRIGSSYGDTHRCVKSPVLVNCSSEVRIAEADFDGCEPTKLAIKVKANGTSVCAEGGVPGMDIGFFDVDGNPCGFGWDTNAVVRCKVLGAPDGICAGAPNPIEGNSVMGARYALCGGYPREQKAAFVSEAGNCQVQGDCLMSPHSPNNYFNNDACSLTVLKSGRLIVEHFDTQRSHDVLTVRGVTYSGFHGPNGVFVNVGDQIEWITDTSVTDSGWKICLDSSHHRTDVREFIEVNAFAMFVFVALLLACYVRRRSRTRKKLAEPLLEADSLSDNEKAAIQAMVDPFIFDCSDGGKQFRCIQIAVPGRHALKNQRSVESEVRVTEFGNCTHIQVTLTKQEDIPKDVRVVHSGEEAGTRSFSAIRGAWVWKKDFDFTDGPWVLDDSISMPSMRGHPDIDMHGVIQINLVRTSPPSPKVLKSGFKMDSETFVQSVESDCMSDIGPSASTLNDEHEGKYIQNGMGDVEAALHPEIATDGGDSSIGSFRMA